ncbi:prephenate dehydratase [Arthrobacter cryoconiti]|uniref:Prephenate dehydratase n=1 Tax=Arthrobacter cryoconiti TaxID=748907 RepID=A0ABV8QY11_9MICC|nr:prephenate dehydratase [Arthrobacter cryoconiti]MCC9067401.1 prephenate dehydratase [Arthrobacter cryoconiti]
MTDVPGISPLPYTFLGPEGTFTESALLLVPAAADAQRVPSTNAASALSMVRRGEAFAAMLPIENSIEGGVPATLDAISNGVELRILHEVVVPVSFVLVAKDGVRLEDITDVGTHPHAWAQTRDWFGEHLPHAAHVATNSTAAAAYELLGAAPTFQGAVCASLVAQRTGLKVLAAGIEDNTGAVTRFVLVGGSEFLPEPTGADKTTLSIPLPEDRPGALMDILEQFASRGVNLSRIESRPTGQFLGHYNFSIDVDGHIRDARVADAVRGLRRVSPGIRFLGSYPRADQQAPLIRPYDSDEVFAEADAWVQSLLR